MNVWVRSEVGEEVGRKVSGDDDLIRTLKYLNDRGIPAHLNHLQPVLLRLQPILAPKAVAHFMFSGVLVGGGAEVSVAMVWCADIGCRG